MTISPKRLLGPPAVWTAFATQGLWKNWVMVLQLGVVALLTQVCFALARVQPDVIVVDDAGSSRYVERTVTSAALVRFLETERKRPTDLTIAAFTERIFMTDLRTFLMPSLMDSFKLAHETKLSQRKLLGALGVAVLVSIASSYFAASSPATTAAPSPSPAGSASPVPSSLSAR